MVKFNRAKAFAVHPWLFALFPLLSFYGANASELRTEDFNIGIFLLFNALVAAGTWGMALAVTRHRQKASILAAVFLTIFFLFGQLHTAMEGFVIRTPIINFGPAKILAMFAVLLVGGTWLLLRRWAEDSLIKVNTTLAAIGGVLILTTIVPIASPYIFGGDSSDTTATTSKSKVDANQSKPDIYYILLDGYGRADYLKEQYQLDNTPFLDYLKDKGFYVADKANSNYAHTHVSVPSTFNMKYLDEVARKMGPDSIDRLPLKDLTRENSVVPKFKSLGYKYANIGSGWTWSSKSPYNNVNIKDTTGATSKVMGLDLNEFALVYLQTTALKPLLASSLKEGLATKILSAFSKTSKVPSVKEPTLSFTHIQSPHPPFIFDSHGIVKGLTPLQLESSSYSNRQAFAEQTRFVNKQMRLVIDKILKDSKQPPIIVIASDHGPGSELNRQDYEETNKSKLDVHGVQMRLAILNAYYFPDQNYANLYPTISPVNTFRLILKQYFDQKINLLPDKSYLSDNKFHQYRMIDVTDIVNAKGE